MFYNEVNFVFYFLLLDNFVFNFYLKVKEIIVLFVNYIDSFIRLNYFKNVDLKVGLLE